MNQEGVSEMTSEAPENSSNDQNAEAGETPETSADKFSPAELSGRPATPTTNGADVNLDLVLNVPVNVSLRVGSTEISIRDLVKLVEGSVIVLDQDADEAMDILVNGTLIAHGEIVVADEKFGVRLTDVVSPTERIENLN